MVSGEMINLIWPPRILHPNARPNIFAKAKVIKEVREYARVMAVSSGLKMDADKKLHLHAIFFPPDKRRRDIDGMLSSAKAMIDGISDGFGINDYAFRSASVEIGDVMKGGGVSIFIREIAA